MNKTFYFIFFIDVSGSMLGKNISVVNAALTECINILQSAHTGHNSDIQLGIFSFSERVYKVVHLRPICDIDSPLIRVVPDREGFYSLSSYTCLYNGMERLFQNLKFDINKDNAFIFIATDGKSTDSKNDTIIKNVKHFPIYQKALKYIALTDGNVKNLKEDVLAFVDGVTDNIIPLDQLPDMIAKLQVLLENS